MKHLDPYLKAETLGFTEKDRKILIGLADDLVNERLPAEDWGMCSWKTCICGNMERRGSDLHHRPFGAEKQRYTPLFVGFGQKMKPTRASWNITQKEAGQAAYNFLTLGDPRWEEVLQ